MLFTTCTRFLRLGCHFRQGRTSKRPVFYVVRVVCCAVRLSVPCTGILRTVFVKIPKQQCPQRTLGMSDFHLRRGRGGGGTGPTNVQWDALTESFGQAPSGGSDKRYPFRASGRDFFLVWYHPPPRPSLSIPGGGGVTWPMSNNKSIINHRRRRKICSWWLGILDFRLLSCGARPPGGGGNRHLVTVFPRVGENRRPWGRVSIRGRGGQFSILVDNYFPPPNVLMRVFSLIPNAAPCFTVEIFGEFYPNVKCHGPSSRCCSRRGGGA